MAKQHQPEATLDLEMSRELKCCFLYLCDYFIISLPGVTTRGRTRSSVSRLLLHFICSELSQWVNEPPVKMLLHQVGFLRAALCKQRHVAYMSAHGGTTHIYIMEGVTQKLLLASFFFWSRKGVTLWSAQLWQEEANQRSYKLVKNSVH